LPRITAAVATHALGGLAARRFDWRSSGTVLRVTAAFLLSGALAAIVLAISGTGENGIALALRVTARWCFVLFWPAYAGGALAKLCGARFAILTRHGREFGLAFAAALSVHIGLVLWLYSVAVDQRSPMPLFWLGALCTYALAILSLRRLREALGLRAWRLLCALALHYIAFVFAVDFIVEPLRASGGESYPLTYLPFALTLLAGVALRLAVQLRRQTAAGKA
jgi:hypothetical protein